MNSSPPAIVFESVRRADVQVLRVRVLGRATKDFELAHANQALTRLRQRLPDLLEPFRIAVGKVDSELTPDQALAAALHLDRLAYGFLDELLVGSTWRPGPFIDALAEHIWPAFQNGRAPIVELRATSSDPFASLLPLELFPFVEPSSPYDRRVGEPFGRRMSRYLGFRALIIRSQGGTSGPIARNAMGLIPIYIIALTDTRFRGVRRQVSFFRSRVRDFSVETDWPDPKTVNPDIAPDDLARALLARDGLLHFCCHFHAERYGEEPYFDFGGLPGRAPIRVTLSELRGALANQQNSSGPSPAQKLVFINTCRSGAHYETSLVGFLQEKRFTEIVGSESRLPDPVAGEYAIRFYTALLRGKSKAAAILQARRDLLERQRNPAGLLYTSYGDPELCLQTRSVHLEGS